MASGYTESLFPSEVHPFGLPFPGITYNEPDLPNWVGHLLTKYAAGARYKWNPEKSQEQLDNVLLGEEKKKQQPVPENSPSWVIRSLKFVGKGNSKRRGNKADDLDNRKAAEKLLEADQDQEYLDRPLLAFVYAKGGDTVVGVKRQIQRQFLPNAGVRPGWATWGRADSLFSKPLYHPMVWCNIE